MVFAASKRGEMSHISNTIVVDVDQRKDGNIY